LYHSSEDLFSGVKHRRIPSLCVAGELERSILEKCTVRRTPAAGQAETDTEKRQAMYSEMQRICSDDGGVIIPIFTNILDAAHARVATGKLAGNLSGPAKSAASTSGREGQFAAPVM